MKKHHVIIFLSLITVIAYIDLVDSCKKINKVTAKTFETVQQGVNYDKPLKDYVSGYFRMKK